MREIYLIDNLKINMLIENNLIDFEKIVIDVASKFAHIDNCDVIVNLKVKITRIVVHERIYVKKVVNVLLRSKITISIHYTSISKDRNFLFESNELNLLLYAYLINFDI